VIAGGLTDGEIERQLQLELQLNLDLAYSLRDALWDSWRAWHDAYPHPGTPQGWLAWRQAWRN